MADSVDQRVALAIESALHGRYVKRQAVGRGAYGEVWMIERVSDGVKCVAKVMQTEKQHRYEAEVQCLISCQHFAIIGFVETVQSSIGPVIVLEYADGGDLAGYIKSVAAAKPLSEQFIGVHFVQLVLALHHIHVKRMMHRDIKSANILLTKNGMCKLSDFGFSRLFDSTVSQDVADTFLGTPYYLAPELWKRQKYSKKADVWSLGVVLYEMMGRKRPFVSANMKGLMNAIIGGEFALPSDGYSPGLVEVLKSMLQVDPAKRPSTAELLARPVLRDFAKQFVEQVGVNPMMSPELKASIASTVEHQLVDCTDTGAHDNEEAAPEERIWLEGPVMIGSLKEWKNRYVTLTDQALVVTRVKEDKKSQKLEFSSITKVGLPQLPDGVQDDTLMVVFLNSGFTVWMKCASSEERDQWVSTVQAKMAEAAAGQPH